MKKTFLFLTLLTLVISACNMAGPATPSALATQPLALPTATDLPTEIPTDVPTAIPPTATPVPTETATPVPLASKQVTFVEKVNCLVGPDTHYYRVVTYLPDQIADLKGRSDDSAWLVVAVTVPNKDPFCFVPLSSVENPAEISSLAVIPAVPLPEAPLSMAATNGVCGTTSTHMTITWVQAAPGAGYRIYRNGKNIGTVYGSKFRDFETPRSKTPYIYFYEIRAFNAAGESVKSVSTSVTLCG
jgi:hypothetical protein